MLGVVQAQQVQVSNDGRGLNDIPIKVATKTVSTLLTVTWCYTLFCLLLSIILLSTNQSYHQYLLVFFSRMTTRCCLAAFRLRLVVIVD